MKIYLCGQKYFGAETFKLLITDGHEIVGVSSPAGDGDKIDRLRELAEKNGIPWMKAGELNEDNFPQGVDLIVTAHSHDFVREPIRNLAKYGAVGYHPSLLPLHRGKDAIHWTIEMGDKVTGGSVYWLTDGMDEGPIAAQEHVFVLPGDTPESIWKRDLAPLGFKLLRQVVKDISQGIIIKINQDERLATVEPSLKKAA